MRQGNPNRTSSQQRSPYMSACDNYYIRLYELAQRRAESSKNHNFAKTLDVKIRNLFEKAIKSGCSERRCEEELRDGFNSMKYT